MSETAERTHHYHAEASVLGGHLRLPLCQQIKPQAHVKLAREGGYISQRAENYRLEAVISFRSAYTHVAGNRSHKPGEGWYTLTSSVIEGLNVLDVITADRVVGQTITHHPLAGYVPTISFLGTRFENLRIAGHPVELELDYEIFGSKPADDAPYTSDAGFLSRVSRQYDRIRGHQDLPENLAEHYNRLSSTLGGREAVECSLVNQAAGRYPGRCYGHVIKIPDIGVITLGKLVLKQEDFHQKTGVPKKTTIHLTMIDLKLGCVIDGDIPIGGGTSNGESQP
ncbi:MAG: hypothetical protein ABSC48_00325 [Terracidiphilus sp.]|jgi:hypothetical protein